MKNFILVTVISALAGLTFATIKTNIKLNKQIKKMENVKKTNNVNEFQLACEPLIKYINENHNPHTRVIVDCNSAELLSGEIVFIKD